MTTDIVRDTASMSVVETTTGLNLEFTTANGTKVRLRLATQDDALHLLGNIFEAINRRWPR